MPDLEVLILRFGNVVSNIFVSSSTLEYRIKDKLEISQCNSNGRGGEGWENQKLHFKLNMSLCSFL